MKALSINQPYGWLIAENLKNIENRDWNTKFRGDFLIHVGLKVAFDDVAWCERIVGRITPRTFKTGGIIAKATLVDVVTESSSPWFVGRYGFVLENIERIPFRPCKGQLGFFTPDYSSVYARDKPKPITSTGSLL